VVVIFNLQTPEYKQAVIEHELLHAMGIRGHPEKLFWSQLSSMGGSIAPLLGPTSFDHQLLQFLYSEVEPGEYASDVEKKLKLWWTPTAKLSAATSPCVVSTVMKQNGGDDIKGEDLLRLLLCKRRSGS